MVVLSGFGSCVLFYSVNFTGHLFFLADSLCPTYLTHDRSGVPSYTKISFQLAGGLMSNCPVHNQLILSQESFVTGDQSLSQGEGKYSSDIYFLNLCPLILFLIFALKNSKGILPKF